MCYTHSKVNKAYKIFLIFLFVITLPACYIFAAGSPDKNKSNKETSDPSEQGGIKTPNWVKRTNFAIEVGSDQKPKYFIETVQPFLGSEDNDWVLFDQLRVSERANRPMYNAGLGARKILGEGYLLGINGFYDYQELHKHHRGGVGFEAITDKGLEARVNTYIRISRERVVNEDAFNKQYEKVANGFDYELGGPIPHSPFLKMYAGGYWYDFEHFKNKYGWKLRAEITPLRYSRLTLGLFDDTKLDNPGYSIEGAITFGFTSFSPKDLARDFRPTEEAYPKVDLHKKMLNRVVRDFDITVIKTTKSKMTGLAVEGGNKN